MLIRFVARIVVLAVIIGLITRLVPGIKVHGGWEWFVWIALIFSAINMILGPIVRLVSLPLIILTLGLFLFVINAAMLAITAAVTTHLDIRGAGSALYGGLLIAVFSWIAELLLPFLRKRR